MLKIKAINTYSLAYAVLFLGRQYLISKKELSTIKSASLFIVTMFAPILPMFAGA